MTASAEDKVRNGRRGLFGGEKVPMDTTGVTAGLVWDKLCVYGQKVSVCKTRVAHGKHFCSPLSPFTHSIGFFSSPQRKNLIHQMTGNPHMISNFPETLLRNSFPDKIIHSLCRPKGASPSEHLCTPRQASESLAAQHSQHKTWRFQEFFITLLLNS